MAFSYSDENFTVIGNLCFVHIVVQGTDATYAIPPAISDRMLLDNFYCGYTALDTVSTYINVVAPSLTTVYAHIFNGNIYCDGEGYLSFCFPIDSNM